MFVASTISRATSVSASSRASPRARVPSDVSWSSPSKKGFGVLTRCVVTARGRGRVRASASRPRDDRVAPAPTLADAIDPPETALVTLARRHVARRYDRESARHLLGSLRAHGVETAADLRHHLLSHALPRLAGQAGQILVVSLGAWAAIAAQSHVARHGGHLDVSTAVAWLGRREGSAACALDYPGHGVALDADEDALAELYLQNAGRESASRPTRRTGERTPRTSTTTGEGLRRRPVVGRRLPHPRHGAAGRPRPRPVPTRETGAATRRRDGRSPTAAWRCAPTGMRARTLTISADWTIIARALGGSLGGINIGVAASIMDDVDVFVPLAIGFSRSCSKVAFRTQIGGAVEAMHGRLMSPLILGYPTEDGRLQVVQMVLGPPHEDPVHRHHGPAAAISRIIVENLNSGEVREDDAPTAASAWASRPTR